MEQQPPPQLGGRRNRRGRLSGARGWLHAVAVGLVVGLVDVGVDELVQALGGEAGAVTGVDGAGIQFAESCHGHEVVVDV